MKGCAAARFIDVAMRDRVRRRSRSALRHRIYSLLIAPMAAIAVLLALSLPAYARPWGQHGEHGGNHAAMGARGHWENPGFQHQRPQHERQQNMDQGPRRNQEQNQERGRYMRPQNHPGREHLPEWYQNHQHMTFKQQERALRRQPGFHRLHPDQQRRILNRLHYLDAQPPAMRQRIMARNEAFERLSPERRQEVRAAAQAFRRMPQDRKQQLGRAFRELRMIPPDERTMILNSARFQSEYSPRERHILGNLLSIEPWQQPPPPPPPVQPH